MPSVRRTFGRKRSPSPCATRSLDLLQRYTDTSIRLSNEVPTTPAFRSTVAEGGEIHRLLWRQAGDALAAAPTASAPRLYVETLNEMIDMQTTRVAALNNRVPGSVLVLEVFGAAIAVGLLALYMAMLGRGPITVVLAAVLLMLLLLVTFDLDRPTRGLIQVPDASLKALRASMELPPAATGARRLATEPGQLFEVGAVLRRLFRIVARR